MREVQPTVRLVSRPVVNEPMMYAYLSEVGGLRWFERVFDMDHWEDYNEGQTLVEFAGRLCYRSWKEGLNPNVLKVREDSEAYLRNLLTSGHGSVLEHIQFGFVASGVSRVFTHELVRHRVGTAYSQESLRYVRLDNLDFWFPAWFKRDHRKAYRKAKRFVKKMEKFQKELGNEFGLDDDGVNFAEKKAKTSFMRRFAPIGLGTTIMFTMNARTLRHFIEMRTSEHAEEEIRIVAQAVAEIMIEEAPLLFGDYEVDNKVWATQNRKV